MEISIENIHKRQDPYQLFLDHFKNDLTRTKYTKILHRFLQLIPNQIYAHAQTEEPKSSDIESLANCFVLLAQKEPKTVRNIIAAFIEEEKKLVDTKALNPNTVPNHVKPIKVLLDSNSIPLHWKSLTSMFPRQQETNDRGYEREELQKMLDVAKSLVDKVIVTLFSSAGFRIEAWNYFTWKDLTFIRYSDGSFKGGALLVYRGDPEQYYTHFTPEAAKYLEEYRQYWKSKTGRHPSENDPLLRSEKIPVTTRLNALGVKKRLDKLTRMAGLRSEYVDGKKRYEVPLDHGFRKYFNTMLRRAKVHPLDKEDMMGHATGLERHYERYKDEDFERFSEYQKAVPLLTIVDEERLKLENQRLEDEKSTLEKQNAELQEYKRKIDELWDDKQRMEQSSKE